MVKIQFQDNVTKANANTFNTMQDNIEDAIDGIIESGSNANGNYVKYIDGTMICWKTTNFPNLAITGSFQGVYYANSGDINFPQTFYSVPVVNVLTSIGGGGFAIYGGTSLTTQKFNGFFWKTQSTTMDVICHWVAYGRWKA